MTHRWEITTSFCPSCANFQVCGYKLHRHIAIYIHVVLTTLLNRTCTLNSAHPHAAAVRSSTRSRRATLTLCSKAIPSKDIPTSIFTMLVTAWSRCSSLFAIFIIPARIILVCILLHNHPYFFSLFFYTCIV